ncbi:MAG: tetraacyldisaccharide 4'-kinase [Burkholderiales bacterium]
MRESLEATLVSGWRRRGLLAWLLRPLSLLYGAATTARRWLYQRGFMASESVDVPVIVVGNLVAGGAGKTPVTIELVRHLVARGVAAGVVSRGHGRKLSRLLPDVREVGANSSAAEAGDEPLLIRRATGAPVFVGRDRPAAARALLAAHPELRIILSDDGLQHFRLQRDAEICVIGARGFGNGWPLPAGPLRETGRRVTWVLDGRSEPQPQPQPSWSPSPSPMPQPVDERIVRASDGQFTISRRLADHALAADGSRIALASLIGTPLTAVAAIADPSAFFDMLRAEGLSLTNCQALPDHYDFDSYKAPTNERGRLVCTEKDAVKLWPTHPHALAVPLALTIDPAFFAALDVWLDAGLGAPPAAPLSSGDGHPPP